MSFDLKCTYANDLCTFNEVEYCFSGCEIVKPCPQTLSPMVDQLLGIRSLSLICQNSSTGTFPYHLSSVPFSNHFCSSVKVQNAKAQQTAQANSNLHHVDSFEIIDITHW